MIPAEVFDLIFWIGMVIAAGLVGYIAGMVHAANIIDRKRS